jgi:hypothetical protein
MSPVLTTSVVLLIVATIFMVCGRGWGIAAVIILLLVAVLSF